MLRFDVQNAENITMPLEFQWPFPSTNKVPKKWAILSKIVIASVGGMSKFWIGKLRFDV